MTRTHAEVIETAENLLRETTLFLRNNCHPWAASRLATAARELTSVRMQLTGQGHLTGTIEVPPYDDEEGK